MFVAGYLRLTLRTAVISSAAQDKDVTERTVKV